MIARDGAEIYGIYAYDCFTGYNLLVKNIYQSSYISYTISGHSITFSPSTVTIHILRMVK